MGQFLFFISNGSDLCVKTTEAEGKECLQEELIKLKMKDILLNKLNFKQSADSSGAIVNSRDELRMTGIQIFLMLDANQYDLSLFYIIFSIVAAVGLIYFLRIFMLWLVMICSSNSNEFNEIKYEAGI